MKYDVIIVGAGPSGLTAALNLWKSNIKNICIITKGDINTHKPCAGLLTRKTINELRKLDLNVEKELEYKPWYSLNIYYRNELQFTMDLDNELAYCPPTFARDQLDCFLYEKVLEKGIKIFEHENIENVDFLKNDIRSEKNNWHYQYLIFADGVNGFSKMYHKKNKIKHISFEAIIKDEKPAPFVNLYFDSINKGYAWVGSTSKIANIGFAHPYDPKIDYIQLMVDFGKENGYRIEKNDIKGAFFPERVRRLTIGNNVFFAGDAAGLADPMTAKGLYYSFKSSYSVARAISVGNFNLYKKEMKKEVKHLKFARLFMKIFFSNLFKKYFWRKSKGKEASFRKEAFNKIHLLGEYSYFEIYKCYKEYRKRRSWRK